MARQDPAQAQERGTAKDQQVQARDNQQSSYYYVTRRCQLTSVFVLQRIVSLSAFLCIYLIFTDVFASQCLIRWIDWMLVTNSHQWYLMNFEFIRKCFCQIFSFMSQTLQWSLAGVSLVIIPIEYYGNECTTTRSRLYRMLLRHQIRAQRSIPPIKYLSHYVFALQRL